MSKIKSAFQSGKAFIPFVTCGDPSLDVTEQIVYAMADAGADLIELGIPFSDPTAEGPVIQEANVRALSEIRQLIRGKVQTTHFGEDSGWHAASARPPAKLGCYCWPGRGPTIRLPEILGQPFM